jgi:cobalamin biosynthesis protein CbiG
LPPWLKPALPLPDKFPAGPAVYVLTGQGLAVARRIAAALDARLYISRSVQEEEARPPGAYRVHPSDFTSAGKRLPPRRFSRLIEAVRARFHEHGAHIFITAAGIAVRAVAPLLQDKNRDPAVLVIDQRGRFVISLASGHAGGANALTMRVATMLGAVPVITTATDVERLPALDVLAKDRGLGIAAPAAIRTISAELLAGRRILLHDPENWLGMKGSVWEDLFLPEPDMRRVLEAVLQPRVIVTEQALPAAGAPSLVRGRSLCLTLHPRLLHVGIGCRKGTSAQEIVRHIRESLAVASLPEAAVAALASLDAKRAEAGLAGAARELSLDVCFFSAEELACYSVSAPSPMAVRRFGIQGVCEPAALAAAGQGARLLVAKKSGGRVTLAVARAARPCLQTPAWESAHQPPA